VVGFLLGAGILINYFGRVNTSRRRNSSRNSG
jgi:hypothetical protein